MALREEAREAAETALRLQPNLGEALLAKGFYHYACLKDYDTASKYLEQAERFLPNSSRVLQGPGLRRAEAGQLGKKRGVFQRSREARSTER